MFKYVIYVGIFCIISPTLNVRSEPLEILSQKKWYKKDSGKKIEVCTHLLKSSVIVIEGVF